MAVQSCETRRRWISRRFIRINLTIMDEHPYDSFACEYLEVNELLSVPTPNQPIVSPQASHNDDFYEKLTPFELFSAATQAEFYRPLPDDWLIVITDVQGSTQAIQEGRYKDVNGLGVASIAAVLNAVKPRRIPYVFGGDGATFALPLSYQSVVAEALVATREMAEQAFNLTLRIGMVSTSTIYAQGHRILLGQYQPTPHYRQAMFLGDGLGYAERLIKDPAKTNPYLLPTDGSIKGHADFTGFECRWNEIASPHEETISLLVQARAQNMADQTTVYTQVLQHIDALYGDERQCHPLREDLMTLSSSSSTLSTEIAIKTSAKSRWQQWLYAVRLSWITTLGRGLMRRKMRLGHIEWGRYKSSLIANTDHRKFDEVLRMVIAGKVAQRTQLRAYLEQRRQAGDLVFGIHAASTALITCVINNYDQDHVHFLDASQGGYALAAKEMKAQLANLNLVMTK